eukprot:GHVS01099092.1.p1 GENE.GHVS01099092.1~~GHVS01099092.1.p1  ORF type:complete len:288 (+),score=61.67 GHVS01099092.1:68-865(+)
MATTTPTTPSVNPTYDVQPDVLAEPVVAGGGERVCGVSVDGREMSAIVRVVACFGFSILIVQLMDVVFAFLSNCFLIGSLDILFLLTLPFFFWCSHRTTSSKKCGGCLQRGGGAVSFSLFLVFVIIFFCYTFGAFVMSCIYTHDVEKDETYGTYEYRQELFGYFIILVSLHVALILLIPTWFVYALRLLRCIKRSSLAGQAALTTSGGGSGSSFFTRTTGPPVGGAQPVTSGSYAYDIGGLREAVVVGKCVPSSPSTVGGSTEGM